MEDAVNRFESLMKTTEDKVEALENKMDEKFNAGVLGNDNDGGSEPSLLQVFEEVKNEYAEICKGAQEVTKFQRDIAMAMKEELLGLTYQLQAMQSVTPGQQVDEDEVKDHAEKLVNRSDIINQSDLSVNMTNNTTSQLNTT